MVKDTKRITRIFGVTRRGKFHIMRTARKVYCKGTFADIARVVHVGALPASSVCQHCVKACMADEGLVL